MATGRVNVGGGGARLNIYTQLIAPTEKEGIWLETNAKYQKIVNDTELQFVDGWIDPDLNLFANMPATRFQHESIEVDGKIYVFGGLNGTSTSAASGTHTKTVFCYDVASNIWSQLGDMPSVLAFFAITSQNEFIYISGGSLNYNNAPSDTFLRYDTINQTWQTLAPMPTRKLAHRMIRVNDSIFAIGGGTNSIDNISTTAVNTVYKYSINNNIWEIIAPMPNTRALFIAEKIGEKIYIFGGQSNYTILNILDTITSTWTTHTFSASVIRENASSASVGEKIYIYGGYATKSTATTAVYALDVAKLVLTQLTDAPMPTTLQGQSSVLYNAKMYIMGGEINSSGISNKVYVMSFISKQFDENTLVLFRSHSTLGEYYTEFLTPLIKIEGVSSTRITSGFNDVWLFKDNDLQEYPCYYGDGDQWIKFKN